METILIRARLEPYQWRQLRKQAIDSERGIAEHVGEVIRLGMKEHRRLEKERKEDGK